MKPLFVIVSHNKGEQCDNFPFGSLHENKSDIYAFCEIEQVHADTNKKQCPYCEKHYLSDVPFIKSNQKSDNREMCLNCYGKRYTVDHWNFYNVMKQLVLYDLGRKNQQSGKVFTVEEIKEKLLKLNPQIVENSNYTNPFLYRHIKEWYYELEKL